MLSALVLAVAPAVSALAPATAPGTAQGDARPYPHAFGVGIVAAQTDGLDRCMDLLREMRLLAVRADDPRLTPAERDGLEQSFQTAVATFDLITRSTQHGGMGVLELNGAVDVEARPGSLETLQVLLLDVTAPTLGVDTLDLTSPDNAGGARSQVDAVLGVVAQVSQAVCATWEMLDGRRGCARSEEVCFGSINSLGLEAGLFVSGTLSFDDPVVAGLFALDLPPDGRVVFVAGQSREAIPFESGTLCVGTHVHRLGRLRSSGSVGVAVVEILGHPGNPADPGRSGARVARDVFRPGETWFLQAVYTDPLANPGGSGMQVTSALRVTFDG